ncbi:hypothetical protein [Streptomyces sp. uw30]|uniref:hypothetical protein n=1 Tax=Streptomyces sp. uw30 TaxID=1828179 RepID=UPI0011CEB46C|nr:hypothetical protein [Streptomyces sp. uw30]
MFGFEEVAVQRRSSRRPVGRYPSIRLKHQFDVTRFGDGLIEQYELHPLRVMRLDREAFHTDLTCPTCTLTVPGTILSMAQTRKRRRVWGTLALTGAISVICLAWLAVLNFDPDGSVGAIFAWTWGPLGALIATAGLIDVWWREDGVWLRDHSSDARIPRLGPRARAGLHQLGYR